MLLDAAAAQLEVGSHADAHVGDRHVDAQVILEELVHVGEHPVPKALDDLLDLLRKEIVSQILLADAPSHFAEHLQERLVERVAHADQERVHAFLRVAAAVLYDPDVLLAKLQPLDESLVRDISDAGTLMKEKIGCGIRCTSRATDAAVVSRVAPWSPMWRPLAWAS